MFDELAIEANRLGKSYASGRVLEGVDLRVPRGNVFAMLGPNGAGKTTTVRILATLLTPDAGQARVAGHDTRTERREVRRRISLTGQYVAVDEAQTGRENLEMIGRLLRMTGSTARARARELLAQFDLVEAGDRRVATYSGGMRRRMDLAASLIGHPEVVFLDEPTTGLDPRSRQAMWEIVTRLTAAGVTVFLTTQHLDEADALADRIAVLDGGTIVAEGTPDELKHQIAEQRLELHLADAAAFDQISDDLGARATSADRSTLTVGVATDGAAADIRRLLDEIDPRRERVARFTLKRATLDDVFMALTGDHTDTTESETTNV